VRAAVFSLRSVPVMTSCNRRGSSVFFAVCSVNDVMQQYRQQCFLCGLFR
jgi:hypothetical protein